MAQAGECQDHGPHQPSRPEQDAQRYEYENAGPRYPVVGPRRHRIDDMATVELSAGQEVQRGGKHPNPRRNPNGVQIQVAERNRVWRQRRQNTMYETEDEGIAEV